MNVALAELHARLPASFPIANDRYQYLITNAWPQVEYKVGPKRTMGTGRSVPEFVEVITLTNIERLRVELEGCTVVVACGKHAQIAVKTCVEFLDLPARVAYAAHTSTQGLRAFGGETRPILRWADGVALQLREIEK